MCKMCGQCCRMLHFPDDVHYNIQGKSNSEIYNFLKENMEYLGPSYKIPGAFKRRNGDSWHVYRCKLVTDDNKCSIHENKPMMCSGYPWYDAGKGYGSCPWPYKGCGYERDSYELYMLKLLKIRLQELQEKEIGNEKQNINSSQEGISG